jgi:hypothetical protein
LKDILIDIFHFVIGLIDLDIVIFRGAELCMPATCFRIVVPFPGIFFISRTVAWFSLPPIFISL